mmetsp:Transcript_1835/g.4013  ORF Transcript_1835/g.4013 Transcript_1835/m.4013 type:complete len:201 (-) Transcript_1835:920-1522(-)
MPAAHVVSCEYGRQRHCHVDTPRVEPPIPQLLLLISPGCMRLGFLCQSRELLGIGYQSHTLLFRLFCFFHKVVLAVVAGCTTFDAVPGNCDQEFCCLFRQVEHLRAGAVILLAYPQRLLQSLGAARKRRPKDMILSILGNHDEVQCSRSCRSGLWCYGREVEGVQSIHLSGEVLKGLMDLACILLDLPNAASGLRRDINA